MLRQRAVEGEKLFEPRRATEGRGYLQASGRVTRRWLQPVSCACRRRASRELSSRRSPAAAGSRRSIRASSGLSRRHHRHRRALRNEHRGDHVSDHSVLPLQLPDQWRRGALQLRDPAIDRAAPLDVHRHQLDQTVAALQDHLRLVNGHDLHIPSTIELWTGHFSISARGGQLLSRRWPPSRCHATPTCNCSL